MSHHYSLRSRGIVEVPSYSYVVNRNLIGTDSGGNENTNEYQEGDLSDNVALNQNEGPGDADTGQHDSTNQENHESQERSTQTDGASHNNSANQNAELEQNESGHAHTTTRGPDFVDAARSASHKLISELERLRADKVQHENIIMKLLQELNLKHDQIQPLSNMYQQKAVPKLPDFTGSHDDEKFDIWITRFNEALYKFNSSEKLDQLLPRLRGIAADFVFDQLSPEVRSDYHALVYELRKQFQTFETPRMYQAQYDKRKQKIGEDVHSFAIELKRLYDKAYPGRSQSIRNEDLVRKFFDGLLDEKASGQVEYFKSPKTIDHAVYEMIHYMDIIGQSQSTSHLTEADLN